MNLLVVFLQAAGGGMDMSFLIMIVALFAIMYFFMIRPQNKKQKEIANFRKNLEIGQEVITAGGVYGKIRELSDNYVILEIASAVRIKIDRNSIYANAPSAHGQQGVK
ncbi:preprotein translocase subunit YajC [Phocaeicola abscessus]|uniref:preprotein translocase subunit YajC n=1 Tax=Phocaeicola abscessus TaxID=555313 RepID=UPI000386A300|nr:preprotein translocase subunit YajC [Phocaeicola abscessus]EPT33905.1 preprotein translocase, YajC subunit [Bacteroidetes bacterium oral taxon 272 str. F0290]